MPVGRPTKRSAEMRDLAEHYLDNFDQEEYGDAVPSAAALSLVLGISRSTLYEWADVDSEFRDILARINAKQERVCINKSLTGDYNATIAKLLLGKHGYHDKVDSNQNVTIKPHEDWLDDLDE